MRDKMAIVCAVNNEESLERDLLSSPLLRDGQVPVVTIRDAKSAGEAYNAGLRATDQEYIIFVHQDVYLPRGWDLELSRNIQRLRQERAPWAVLGCIGVTRGGEFAGTCWSSGARREHRHGPERPTVVTSLDEVVLVVRRSTDVLFDPRLPFFHLYGTDIVLTAARAGFQSFAVYAPVVHNSNALRGLDRTYRSAFDYMCAKWRSELPLRTPICVLSTNKLSLWRTHLRLKKRLLVRSLRRRGSFGPLPNPARQAETLGYGATDPKE
jgi:hypothetical protein